MDEDASPLERDHSLAVVLPGGLEKTAAVHGSKPVMDVLVTLCASYHLNPSDYTVEILSANRNSIGFKPNSLIGSLEAEKIVLKPKAMEEKIRRAPYMPEASVRLLINYKERHKTVVRVNPRVPLELLLPAISDKCELNMPTTVLLRDSQSKEPLDLAMSLNDHGLREIYAKDTAAVTPAEIIAPPPPEGLVEVTNQPKKEKKQKGKDDKGFLSLFRRRKKKCETIVVSPPLKDMSASAPASPGPREGQQRGDVLNSLSARPSGGTLPVDLTTTATKKRRAPQPPLGASQSVPNNLGTIHLRGAENSAESTLRRTKRLAPPPPCANAHLGPSAQTDAKGAVSLHTLEEGRESYEPESYNLSSSSSSSSPPLLPLLSPSSSSSPSPPLPPLSPSSSSSSSPPPSSPPPPPIPASTSFPPSARYPQKTHGSHQPTTSTTTTTSAGKDSPHPRVTLAQILTSSLTNEALVQRLRHLSGGASAAAAEPSGRSGAQRADLEWEDPVQRKGVTTFKVIPARKQQCYEVEWEEEVVAPPPPEASARRRVSEDAGRPAADEASVRVGGGETNGQEDLLGSPESLEDADSELHPPPPEFAASVCDDSSSSPPSAPSDSENHPDRATSPVPEVEEDLRPAEGEPAGVPASPGPEIRRRPISPDPGLENNKDPDKASDHGSEVSIVGTLCSPPPPVAQDGSVVSEEGGGLEHVVMEEEDLPPVAGAESPPPAALAEDDVMRLLDASIAFGNTEPDCASLQSATDAGEPPPAEPIPPGPEADDDDEEEDEALFPPPPPPAFFDEEGPEGDRPGKKPTSTSNPLKQIGGAPSRFAQAVALAVQRSRDQRRRGQLQLVDASARVSPSAFPSSTVPDVLPHATSNGSSCLGRGLGGDQRT